MLVTSGDILGCPHRPLVPSHGPPHTQTPPPQELRGCLIPILLSWPWGLAAPVTPHLCSQRKQFGGGNNLPYSSPVRREGCLSLPVLWRGPSQLRSPVREVTLRQDQAHGASPQHTIASAAACKYKSRAKALWQDSHKPHLDLAEKETQTMVQKTKTSEWYKDMKNKLSTPEG